MTFDLRTRDKAAEVAEEMVASLSASINDLHQRRQGGGLASFLNRRLDYDLGARGAAQSIAAAIRALPAASPGGWMPIETAPKEPGRILAVVDGHVRIVGYGKTSHIPLYGFCLLDQGPEDCDLCEPTHWMPLPPPPSQDGDAG